MKKINITLPIVLVTAMLLLTACNGTGSAGDDPPEADASQNENQPAIQLPEPTEPTEPTEPQDDPSETDGAQNGEEVAIQPLPEEPEEADDNRIGIDILLDFEVGEFEEWPPVILDGVGIQGSSHRIVGDDIFPNYVSLVPIAEAFGSQVSIEGDEIVLNGLNGRISFEIGSLIFSVGNTPVRLHHPALVFDRVLYVPIEFFREVFGAGGAFFSGGEVHITTEAGDMH